MLDTIKKCIFYFNAAALSISYLLMSLRFSISALHYAPDGLTNFLAAIKPVNFVLDFINDTMYDLFGAILLYIALVLPIIVSILSLIFLRKELSKRTVLLLSLSFVLPLGLVVIAIINDNFLTDYDLFGYIFSSVLSLFFLAYGITTLVFMHKDNDELDW